MFDWWSSNPARRTRLVAASVAIALHLVVALLLLRARTATTRIGEADLTLFVVHEAQNKPPSPPPEKKRSPRPIDEAAPPNLRSEPSPVVAPLPIVPVVVPPPVTAAPVAGAGSSTEAGAATVPGPGTGADGEGNGRSDRGNGGDGEAGYQPPHQIRGRIRNSDYPESAGTAGASGHVSVRYVVGIDGRVSECAITRSSGNSELDATTCRLITERFRFRPSRGPDGQPSYVIENHSWLFEEEP